MAQAPVASLPMPQPGGHKRTAHVNVAPATQTGDDAEWWDNAGMDAGQWATRTHSALTQPQRPPRRLPALPGAVVSKPESLLNGSESTTDAQLVHPLAPAESLTIVRETNC